MIWLIYAPISLILTIAALFAPIWVAFADEEGNLPRWLSWLQTADNTLDGDSYWRDATAHPLVNKMPRYLMRVLWMWRNPGGGFDLNVAGRDILANAPRTVKGDAATSNQPWNPGYCFARFDNAWMLYAVYPTLPGRCLRLYIGWKLMGAVNQPDKPDRAQFALTINPIMRRN